MTDGRHRRPQAAILASRPEDDMSCLICGNCTQAQDSHPGLAAADVPTPGHLQAACGRRQPRLPRRRQVALLRLVRHLVNIVCAKSRFCARCGAHQVKHGVRHVALLRLVCRPLRALYYVPSLTLYSYPCSSSPSTILCRSALQLRFCARCGSRCPSPSTSQQVRSGSPWPSFGFTRACVLCF